MDRMLVVVFNNEVQAYQGRQALLQLDSDGNISVYAYAVLAKHADGTATVKQGDDSGPIGTLVGTSFGSLIGLLGGPAGLAIGAATGVIAGAAVDLNNARIGDDFIDDVTKVLTPNKFAVVAEGEEDWTHRWIPAWKRSAEPFFGALSRTQNTRSTTRTSQP